MHEFKAALNIIDGNPFVSVPEFILQALFEEAGKSKGPIPIRGVLNERTYQQTLVKYRGGWRLYVNTKMLNKSPKRIGEEVHVSVEYDPSDRTIALHPKLEQALRESAEAKKVFDGLPESRRKEIVRYISFLKTEESVDRNVMKAINFLLGKARFIGRERP